MASKEKNLSDYSQKNIRNISMMNFAIVVAEWNEEITEALYQGAYETLIKFGAKAENISRNDVPGSFELSLGAQFMAQKIDIDAVICLGCIIQGETRHFDFICQGVTQGITTLNLSSSVPVIFGVLTTNNVLQARERAGGKLGNKGSEAAIAALKMIKFNNNFIKI